MIESRNQFNYRRNRKLEAYAGLVHQCIDVMRTYNFSYPSRAVDLISSQLPVRVERIWLMYGEIARFIIAGRRSWNPLGHCRVEEGEMKDQVRGKPFDVSIKPLT